MSQSQNSRLPVIIGGAVAAIFAILCICSLTDISLYTPDSTRYLVWAQSISSFRGFVDATLPEPLHYVIHAPLYSILLAPVALLFPQGVVAAKVLSIIFGLLLLVVFWFWMKGNGTEPAWQWTAVGGVALLALNPLTIIFSTEILSEIPFAILLVLSFILYAKSSGEHGKFYLGLFVACLTSAILVREVGMSLLVAAAVALLVDGRRRAAIITAATSLGVYSTWFIRNEILVAGRELPAMTNSKFFFGHFFTSQDSGLLSEFIERFSTNAKLYIVWLSKLVFTPLYPGTEYKLVSMHAGLPGLIGWAIPFFVILFAAVAAIAIVRGILAEVKNAGSLFVFIFIPCYIGLILLYPINDIRFLFPILVIAIRFLVIGVAEIRQHGLGQVRNGFALRAVLPLVAFAMVPNVLWDIQYAANASSYRANPSGYYETVRGIEAYPWHFTRPFGAVTARLRDLSADHSVVFARRKDIVLGFGDRSVGIFDPGMQLTAFDAFLRDYHVAYIVNVVQPNGIRDFEYLMMQSRRFRFKSVERIGNVEITSVEPAGGVERGYVNPSEFGVGVSFLNNLRYTEAESLFTMQYEVDSQNMTALFYRGVAREFAGKLESAADDFIKLRTIPQVGAFLPLAQKHQSVLATLKTLQGPFSASKKAEAASDIASEYWGEGFRVQARMMSASALRYDSLNVPAMFYGMYYALQEDDTLTARNLFARVSSADTAQVASGGWKALFAVIDSAGSALPDSVLRTLPISIARRMVGMGMNEAAIQVMLSHLHEWPDDFEGMSYLADLYIDRGRYLPAARMLSALMAADPRYPGAHEKMQALAEHFH